VRAVEHHELVAPLDDAGEAEQHAPLGLLLGDAEAKIGLAVSIASAFREPEKASTASCSPTM
jgi:hypothetical protein